MRRLGLTHFILSLVITGQFPADGNAQAQTRSKKPNILVILADDLGYADIGVQGCLDVPTPHIDSLEQNTLIFFLSDNGGPTRVNGSRNTPLRGFKAQIWEGGVRVPFIVQWKGTVPAGKVYADPVIQLDVSPTALAAAGSQVKPEWKLDGVNLLPYLQGKKKTPHEALFWRFGAQMAVRMGDWKLVKAPGSGAEFAERWDAATASGAHLYNLAKDTGEQTNLADHEPEKVKRLTAVWTKWNSELEGARWTPNRGRRNRIR